jgi:hypothetical protein
MFGTWSGSASRLGGCGAGHPRLSLALAKGCAGRWYAGCGIPAAVAARRRAAARGSAVMAPSWPPAVVLFFGEPNRRLFVAAAACGLFTRRRLWAEPVGMLVVGTLLQVPRHQPPPPLLCAGHWLGASAPGAGCCSSPRTTGRQPFGGCGLWQSGQLHLVGAGRRGTLHCKHGALNSVWGGGAGGAVRRIGLDAAQHGASTCQPVRA